MNLYFAPMEGVNGYIYRNAYHTCYAHIDKYFTPFLSPNQHHKFSSKEFGDILPERNQGIHIIPQLLTNRAEDFIWAAGELKNMGYEEVNFNLGCPSSTVVTKRKGSGFLAEPKDLDLFFDQVFHSLDMKLSVKTRLGLENPEEFYHLMDIYNKYPLSELIIHPRIRTDKYKNHPNLPVFRDALALSRNPVCYNGDIFTVEHFNEFTTVFPEVTCCMLGRGLIANPGLAGEIQLQDTPDKERLHQFHDMIYEGYRQVTYGDKNTLFKMKELWAYMSFLFTDSTKYAKQIRKAQRCAEYEAAVTALFCDQELIPGAGFLV